MKNEETIFAAALACENELARRAYLDEACGDDSKLRAGVEGLLRAQNAAGEFLLQPAAGIRLAREDATFVSAADDTAKTGELPSNLHALLKSSLTENSDYLGRLGSYDIVELIGQGGMGSVLRGLGHEAASRGRRQVDV